MEQSKVQEIDPIFEEIFPIIHKTKGYFSIIMIFLIIFALEILGFTSLRYQIAQIFGEEYIVIDIFSVIVQIMGAITLSYLYYTRYLKRELVFDKNTIIFKIGKRKYEYKWDEFSFVSLSIASSHIGAKGFSIRLYESDLEGEYVDLPVYRFPTITDIFDLRIKIDRKIKSLKNL